MLHQIVSLALSAATATIAALPVDEVDALGEYAFPGLVIPGDWPQSVLDRLVAKGLLIRHRRQHFSSGIPVIVDDYEVPLAVHIAYCEWCGELESIPYGDYAP